MRVIISGAAGVLGEAVRVALLRDGAVVSCVAKRRDGEDSDRAGWFACGDLADEEKMKASADEAIAWLGGLHALIDVAGAFRLP